MGKMFKVYCWVEVDTEVEAVDIDDAKEWGAGFFSSIKRSIENDFGANIAMTDTLARELKAVKEES